MEHIAIYARKSTESEDRQVLSIDSQIRELRQYAKSKGWKISSVFSESKSAKSPGRPVFTKLMDGVQAGKISAILCWKLDRLARNPVDGGAIIWALDQKTLNAILTPQRELIDNGNDKFWLQLEFGMAKKYVDDLSENVKRGNRAKLEMGWLPMQAPIGYLNDKENKTIVKDPDKFPIIKRMWRHMLTGRYSVSEIHRRATEDWGLTRRCRRKAGARPLALSGVYTLFENPFYYGMIRYNGEIYKGAHPPMITEQEFDKVQELLGNRHVPKPHRHSFAYTGLLKCGNCGAAVTAEHKKNRYGYRYIYYHCTHHRHPYNCDQKSIEEKKLEQQLATLADSISLPKGFLKWALEVNDELDETEARRHDLEKPKLKRKLSLLEAELEELLSLRLGKIIDDDQFSKRRSKIEKKMASLRDQINSPERIIRQRRATLEQVFSVAENANQVIQSKASESKKRFLRSVCSNLELCDKKVLTQEKKPFRIIRNVKEEAQAKNVMFEPRVFRQLQPKDRARSEAFSIWWGLVKKVRTFCINWDAYRR